jgi:adenine deaminase
VPPVGRHSVKAPPVNAASFRAPPTGRRPTSSASSRARSSPSICARTIPIVDGDKRPDPARDLLRIAVIERHGKNGNIATGFVKGFGMTAGAIAATVCHDHHNIACVGVDYEDMALAANRLSEIEGGFVVARRGRCWPNWRCRWRG